MYMYIQCMYMYIHVYVHGINNCPKVCEIVLWGYSDNTSCQSPEVMINVYVHVCTYYIHIYVFCTYMYIWCTYTFVQCTSLVVLIFSLYVSWITFCSLMSTFGCVEWDSDLCRGVMRARCYPFGMPKHLFHRMNPKVLYIHYTNMYIHESYMYIVCIYIVYTLFMNVCTWLYLISSVVMYRTPSLLSLLILTALRRKKMTRMFRWKTVGMLVLNFSLPATCAQQVGDPKECILQMLTRWPPLPPGVLQHLWGAETAHQRAVGACWGDQVVWCKEAGCSKGAAHARSWDSPASQGWPPAGLMENELEVWLWSSTDVSVQCPNIY